MYMNYRNYIIKLYREDPKTYLTATVCRRTLVDSMLQGRGRLCDPESSRLLGALGTDQLQLRREELQLQLYNVIN